MSNEDTYYSHINYSHIDYPHINIISKYLSSLGINKADQEDIIQETYLAYWKYNKHKHIKYPKAYIIKIAHSILARKFKEDATKLDLIYQLTLEYKNIYQTSSRFYNDSEVISLLQREEIKNALKHMDYKHRLVLLLKFVYNVPTIQIAAKLNVTSRAVNKMVDNALKEIKKRG